MSIYGIGVDLVNAERIQNLYQKYGDRFPKRILNDDEMDLFNKSKKHLALDFPKVFIGKILV